MKKRLFSFALTLTMLAGLCAGMTVTVSADTWTIPNWEQKGEPETGLKIFTEEKMNPGLWSVTGEGALDKFYGLKDAAGNIVLPADYLALQYLGPNRLLVGKTEPAYGVITLNGTVIYPFTASYVRAVEVPGSDNPLLIVGEGSDNYDSSPVDTGLYDWNGQAIIPKGTYKIIRNMEGKNFLLWDKNTNLRGVYEYGTGIVIPCQYKYVRNLGNDMFTVVNSNVACGVVDKTGQQILPFEYEDIISYKQGCFVVGAFLDQGEKELCLSDSLGGGLEYDYTYDALVDGYGKVLIPFGQYDDIYIDDQGFVHGGHWTGEYSTSLVGVSGGIGKIFDYTYHAKLTDLLAEKGGTALPYSPPSTNTPESGIVITIPGTGEITIPISSTNPSEQTPSSSNNSSVFTDVKSTDYYADAVQWAVEKKITSGTSKTTFSPGATCNRAQILSFLWRTSGSPEPTAANPFSDIKSTDYFYKAALWAAEKGMVSGSSFGASTPCTRASTMEYMWKAAGSPAASYNGKFDDVSTSADYAQAVAWAVENNVTAGTSKTTFGPDSTCTRGQIVTFLHRAMGD